MTETWADLVRSTADDIEGEFGSTWRGSSAPKLRRLASLLEQITPDDASDVELGADLCAEHNLKANAKALRDLRDTLAALAATPSEETD